MVPSTSGTSMSWYPNLWSLLVVSTHMASCKKQVYIPVVRHKINWHIPANNVSRNCTSNNTVTELQFDGCLLVRHVARLVYRTRRGHRNCYLYLSVKNKDKQTPRDRTVSNYLVNYIDIVMVVCTAYYLRSHKSCQQEKGSLF